METLPTDATFKKSKKPFVNLTMLGNEECCNVPHGAARLYPLAALVALAGFVCLLVQVLPLYPEPEPFESTRLLVLKVPTQDAPRIPALLERFYRSPKLPE
jgi:hypothetical protein